MNLKILENTDVDIVYDCLHNIKREDYYLSPYLNIDSFTKDFLKQSFFNYSSLFIADLEGDQVKNVVYFELPDVFWNTKAVTILYSANKNEKDYKDFLQNAFKIISSEFEDYNKILIVVKDGDDGITKTLIDLDFVNEVRLEKEINNSDVLYFSKSMKNIQGD